MHAGILLSHLVGDITYKRYTVLRVAIFAVGEVRVKACHRIVRQVYHRPALIFVPCSTLPATTCQRVGIVGIQSAAIQVDGAVVASSGAFVGKPAKCVAEIAEVLVHLLEQSVYGLIGNIGVAVLAPGKSPPAVGLHAYLSHVLGQHLSWCWHALGVVVAVVVAQCRLVVRPSKCHVGIFYSICQRCY